jgi:uncharacterized protein
VRAPLAWATSFLLLAACGGSEAVPANAQAEAPAANASAPAPAEASFPALTGRVVDNANLLSPAEETQLGTELAALERRTSDQLVIVTVPSLNGQTIEAFGLALGRHWGIGQRGKDNGVLLIVAPAERKVRIEVGYGLEAILTNARAQEIIDRDILPAFREGNYSQGIAAGTHQIAATLVAEENQPRGRRR